jgi:hypothetical protein
MRRLMVLATFLSLIVAGSLAGNPAVTARVPSTSAPAVACGGGPLPCMQPVA